MQVTLPSSFRMRVAAVTEAEAAVFARQILPRCCASNGTSLHPLLLSSKRYKGFGHFESIASWSWPTAAAQVARIAAAGFNAVVLSNAFLDWSSEQKVINEEWLAFEKALIEYGVIVFNIETHSTDNMRCIQEHQKINTDWPEVSLEEVLSVMLISYEEGPLIAPWGGVPYILLYPQAPDETQSPGRMIAAGFQVQQYAAVLEWWPEAKGPWWHLTEIKEGVDCTESGPIPMRVI